MDIDGYASDSTGNDTDPILYCISSTFRITFQLTPILFTVTIDTLTRCGGTVYIKSVAFIWLGGGVVSLNDSVLIGDILRWVVIVSRDNDIVVYKQGLCGFGRGGKGMECL